MARKRRKRTPPTPQKRRQAIIIGAVLVAIACFAVLFEAVVNESGRLLNLIVATIVLLIVFILPIVFALRAQHRGTVKTPQKS